ncbi:MAG: HD domain-containing protein [Coriobacteriia bacterium]|nr:HD domain-containing protein [Coriobacteriia bacterium]
MKEQYVRDLAEGVKVDSLFALRSRDLRSARTGEAYLAMELADRSGHMPAVMFRPDATDQSVPVGTVLRVRGTVTTWRGTRRVSVDSLRPEASYEHEDLMQSGTRPRAELLTELRALVKRTRDPGLRAVLKGVFGESGFIDRFAACPAASGRHHAYAGGLLEHTVSVATIVLSLAQVYPQADRDLLLCSALLHDVGKVDELEYETALGYTEAGRLVGHVVLGERRVSRAVERAGSIVPAGAALMLSHALLAHHGELEWGAPRRPCSIEALLLHHADNLDAQAAAFLDAVAGAAVLEQRWSDAANPFGRALVVPGSGVVHAREDACA